MTNLTRTALESIVADYCSRFGRASLLRVSPPDDESELGIAEVEMASLDEADTVARELGDTRRGSRVVIMLVQEERTKTGWMNARRPSSAQPMPGIA